MITYYREMARDTLIESGILKKENDTWKIIAADKYPVVIELAKLTDITTSHARTLINRIITNVQTDPLTDPAADRRGGKRTNAGRKPVQKADKS